MPLCLVSKCPVSKCPVSLLPMVSACPVVPLPFTVLNCQCFPFSFIFPNTLCSPYPFSVLNIPCSHLYSLSRMPRFPFCNYALRFFYIHCPKSHVFPCDLTVRGPPVTADSLNYFRPTPPHACVSRRHLPTGPGGPTSKDCVLIYTTILSVRIWKMTVANPSTAFNCRCIRRFHADCTPRPYITPRRHV